MKWLDLKGLLCAAARYHWHDSFLEHGKRCCIDAEWTYAFARCVVDLWQDSDQYIQKQACEVLGWLSQADLERLYEETIHIHDGKPIWLFINVLGEKFLSTVYEDNRHLEETITGGYFFARFSSRERIANFCAVNHEKSYVHKWATYRLKELGLKAKEIDDLLYEPEEEAVGDSEEE